MSPSNMLLVIDIGNTNIVFGVYRDDTLVNHWRLSTVLEKTADEYAIAPQQPPLFRKAEAHRHTERDHLVRGPAASHPLSIHVQQIHRHRAHRRGAGHKDGHAHPLRKPPGSRRRPHRQCGGGLREAQEGADHSRFRHGHDLRLRDAEGGIRGRRHRPRHHDLPGGPLRAGVEAPEGGAGQAEGDHRKEYGKRHAGGHRVRLRQSRGRHRRRG